LIAPSSPEPDSDRLWLIGEGAEIMITRTEEKNALDIIESVRSRLRAKRENDNDLPNPPRLKNK